MKQHVSLTLNRRRMLGGAAIAALLCTALSSVAVAQVAVQPVSTDTETTVVDQSAAPVAPADLTAPVPDANAQTGPVQSSGFSGPSATTSTRTSIETRSVSSAQNVPPVAQSQSLLLPVATVDEKMIREMLREDIDTMAGVIERLLSERMRGHFQPSNLFQRGVQGWYIEDMGAFFICEVDFDVATPAEESTPAKGKKEADLWDEVRSSLKRGEPAGVMGDFGMRGGMNVGQTTSAGQQEPPGEEQTPETTGFGGAGMSMPGVGLEAPEGLPGEPEKDRRTLLRDLDDLLTEAIHVYGPRVRGLKAREWIVVTVIGRQAGKAPAITEAGMMYGYGFMGGEVDQLQQTKAAREDVLQKLEQELEDAQSEIDAAEDDYMSEEGKLRLNQEKLKFAEEAAAAGRAAPMERLAAQTESQEAERRLKSARRELERRQRALERKQQELEKTRDEMTKLDDALVKAQEYNSELAMLYGMSLERPVSGRGRRTSGMVSGMGMGRGMGYPGMAIGMPLGEHGQQTVRTYRVKCEDLRPDEPQGVRALQTHIFAY